MNYQETIDFLFAKLPMFSRIGPIAFKKDLTNIRALCEALGNPQNKFKSVHIAGTNGKGSTSHMLSAILQKSGYKTGLYTSPHLKDFRERIRIDGTMIEKKFVIEFTDKIAHLIDEIEPSFFEITVAMAFEYFVLNNIDIAVIEVGLGGRFDSTNIIMPEISVITNIGWDHMNMLGNTLDKIAFEKAGIIKPNTPLVIGESRAETSEVFKSRAKEENAPIFFADKIRYADEWKSEKHELFVEVVHSPDNEKKEFYLDLNGIYQTKNLVTVLETIHQLSMQGWNISDASTFEALKNVKKLTGLHGRWDTIHEHPRIVLDVAHNLDGIKQIREQLELTNFKGLHIVIGMVKDKEIAKVLQQLPSQAKYYFTKAQIPRALPESELAAIAKESGLNGEVFPNVNDALKEARAHAHKDDLILVCGSVFVVGEVEI
ncbi:MAG: dihydrofolate synthase [Bacteroidetes bacterium]|nr:MAG: dihydrofolate synthase [Bacteroidota bacterium]